MTDPGGISHLVDPSKRATLIETSGFIVSEGRKPATDFSAGHDRRLEELAREAAAAAARIAEPVLVAPSAQLIDLSLIPDRAEFDLLADARANIQEGEYELAEDQLAEYLETDPDHQEARFLRAFCLSKLGDDREREALRILRPLRDEQTSAELRDQIRGLRDHLRQRLSPREVLAYIKAARTSPRDARDRIREFLELVPEDGTLSYILAMDLALGGDLEQALDTATRGAAEADTGREQVAALARQLTRIIIPELAADAIDAFWAGDLRRARLELARMDPRWRDNVLLNDFDDYILLLLAHPGQVPPPAPRLPERRADDLYSLIAELDCAEANRLMDAHRDSEAEGVLAGAMALVPRFGWLNFLYAVCLYHLGRDPDRAATCAAIAAKDPSIRQANELVEAIGKWQEAVVINPAWEEYDTITRSAGAIKTPQQLSALRRQLVALQQRIPRLRAAARTERGAQAIRNLGDAISKNLTEIDSLEKQLAVSGQVSALVGRFNRLAGQSDRMTVLTELIAIRTEALRLRGSQAGPRDRQLLDEILTEIKRVIP
jgi:thioredoxin-like negative regulator of GroEL